MSERSAWPTVSPITWAVVMLWLFFFRSLDTMWPIQWVVPISVLVGACVPRRVGATLALTTLGTGVVAATVYLLPEIELESTRANELAVLAELRSFRTAQEHYAESSGGFYESRLECLADTARCLPETHGTSLWIEPLDATRGTKDGYLRAFVPSGWMSGTGDGGSPTRVKAFALVAIPTDGSRGRFSFCLDAHGIRSYRRGDVPSVVEGRCS